MDDSDRSFYYSPVLALVRMQDDCRRSIHHLAAGHDSKIDSKMSLSEKEYSIPLILTAIDNAVQLNLTTFTLDGVDVEVTPKLKAFLIRGTSCSFCGLNGEYFKLGRSREGKWLLRLQGIEGGKYVALTVDHVLAQSKGGGDGESNLNVLCGICNKLKEDAIVLLDHFKLDDYEVAYKRSLIVHLVTEYYMDHLITDLKREKLNPQHVLPKLKEIRTKLKNFIKLQHEIPKTTKSKFLKQLEFRPLRRDEIKLT